MICSDFRVHYLQGKLSHDLINLYDLMSLTSFDFINFRRTGSTRNLTKSTESLSNTLYEIEREDVKQLEIGNKSQKVTVTKFTLFTTKPKSDSGRVSPGLGSRHTLLVQRRLFDTSGYMRVVDLQEADGCWSLNNELAEVIAITLMKLKKSCPFVDPSYEVTVQTKRSPRIDHERAELNDKIWATSLSLKWLQRLWSQYKDEWGLVEEKAVKWINNQKLPVGFLVEDVCLMAQQSLNVLIARSRRSSCQ